MYFWEGGGVVGEGGGEALGSGAELDADDVLDAGEVDAFDDFAAEEVEEDGLELDEARVGDEELGGEVH